MSLDTLIMLAGASVAILPFLGFPTSWDTVLFLIAGIFIIGLGIALRRRERVENTRKGNSPAPQATQRTAVSDANDGHESH